MSFSHDIAGGNGELVVPQVVSPNFVHGVTGWRLGKDGSLEAHDIILPDGQGVSVFFAGSAPTTDHVGDLWYDTSNGLELSRWDGSSWVAFQISSGAIATGGVSASNIASLTASLIGNLGVLNPNPYFTGGDSTGWKAQNGTFSVTDSPPTGAPFAYAGLLTANATTPNVLINNGAFQAVPGNQYLITAWVYSSFATIAIGFNWQLGGVYVSTSSTSLTVTANTWTPVSFVATAPASGINRGLPIFATSGGNGATLYVQAALAFPEVPGSLIQAGTVTAAQIAAGVVVAGIIDGTTVQASQYIADGTSGEFLAYTSTPANGNLLLSISPSSGTDGHSNAYKDGLGIYDGTAYVQLHVNSVYGAPAIELPTGIASEHGGAAIYSLPVAKGAVNEHAELNVFGPSSTHDDDYAGVALLSASKDGSSAASGLLTFNTTNVALWNSSSVQLFQPVYGNSGTLTIADKIARSSSGFSGYPCITQTDESEHSNNNLAGAGQITAAYTVPANDAQQGTYYELEVPFAVLMQGATLELGLSIDGSSTFTESVTLGAALVSANTGVDGNMRVRIMIVNTGTSGNGQIFIDGALHTEGTNVLYTDSAGFAHVGSTFNINTTVSHNFRVNSKWGSSVTGQEVNGYGSTFTRKGP